jgi:hypothetical protein
MVKICGPSYVPLNISRFLSSIDLGCLDQPFYRQFICTSFLSRRTTIHPHFSPALFTYVLGKIHSYCAVVQYIRRSSAGWHLATAISVPVVSQCTLAKCPLHTHRSRTPVFHPVRRGTRLTIVPLPSLRFDRTRRFIITFTKQPNQATGVTKEPGFRWRGSS